MATLLRNIQPWMQKSIVDVEDHIEKWVSKKAEKKIHTVHKFLDAFELRLLARPTPATKLPTIQAKLTSLQSDVDAILEMRAIDPESAPTKLAEDTMLDALSRSLLSSNMSNRFIPNDSAPSIPLRLMMRPVR